MVSDNLYTIIKSLTKTEKAYFKKFASRHIFGKKNKYVVLFDAISSLSNGYDEKEIKKKFRNEKFVKNFPVIKKYLTEMILKSLQSFYFDSTPDNEIKNEIRYIEILYKKGLFRNCLKILNRSLKHAYSTDNFLVILDLLRWKKNLIYEGVFHGDEFFNFEQTYKEEQEVINRMKNLSDYRLLSYRARRIAIGTDAVQNANHLRNELLSILNDPLLLSEEQALSDTAVITHYHILAVVYESLGKNIEAIECRRRLINVLEKNPELLKVNISNYIITIYNILGPCLSLKIYSELELYIRKLRQLEKTYPNKITEKDKLYTFIGSSIYELRMHISRGDFCRLSDNVTDIEKGVEKFGNMIVRLDMLYIFYLLGYSYFGSGNINEALKWINKILNDKIVNHDSILVVKSKILRLIIHYELGNFELLDYLIKSTYRFLIKSRFSGKDEKVVIEFLKKLKNVSSGNQLFNLFAESLRRLKENTENFTGNSKLNSSGSFEIQNNFTNSVEFDLESWFESKISGKKFEEIVKDKTYKRK